MSANTRIPSEVRELRVRVTEKELRRLVRGERVPVVRDNSRQGTVEIFDAEWRRVRTGFLTLVGRLKARKGCIEIDGRKIQVKELCNSEE